MKFKIFAAVFAGLVSGALASSSAQTLPAEAPGGPDEDPSFGGGGTFRPYQFDPSYGAGGVDLATGIAGGSATLLSIGGDGTAGLSYARDFSEPNGRYDNFLSSVEVRDGGDDPDTVVINALGTSYSFLRAANGSYTPLYGSGATLSEESSTWTLIDRDGTRYTFRKDRWSDAPVFAPDGRLASVAFPDGVNLQLYYQYRLLCPTSDSVGSGCADKVTVRRLSSVNSTAGYQIKYLYGITRGNYQYDEDGLHTRVRKVIALNNAYDACAKTSNTCRGMDYDWPTVDFSYTGSYETTVTMTNDLNEKTRYSYDFYGRLKGVRFPSSGSAGDDDITYLYHRGAFGTGRVKTVTRDGGSWRYVYSSSQGVITTTVTDPLSNNWTVRTYDEANLPHSETSPLGQTTSYQYGANDLLERVTYPEGNYVTYRRDARGNATRTERHPKPSASGVSAIVTKAGYPSCTSSNRKICNKPEWTTVRYAGADRRTDYTYDTRHGGVTKIRLPDAGKGRLTTDIVYSQRQVRYYRSADKNGGEYFRPHWKPISVTTGTKRTVFGYQGTSSRGNALLYSVRVEATNGREPSATSSYRYDHVGNVTSIDGPLSGTGDKSAMDYDALRRITTMIGPDPDGGGSLLRNATRTLYDVDGRVKEQQRGTASGLTSFSSFSSIERQVRYYDSNGRLAGQQFYAGGAVHATEHYTYDAKGRLECSIQRMSSLGTNTGGCSAGGAGTFGQHRITKRSYDAVDRVTSVTTGYGTSDAVTETMGYYPGGQIKWVKDGRGAKTTYEYDGHLRRKKIRYPVATNGSGTSSTSDYEKFSWVSNEDRMLSQRNRSGQWFQYDHDALGRVTKVNAPGTANDLVVDVDIYGRPTTRTVGGRSLTLVYDALGRLESEAGPLGTVSYDYDVLGRRTRTDYPGSGSFYVTYDYHPNGGALRRIREKGSAVLATYDYDQLGRRKKLTRGNGVVTDYDYDAASRLDDLNVTLPNDSGKNQKADFDYNPAGQITLRTTTNKSYEPTIPAGLTEYTSMRFDALNRISWVNGTTPDYDTRGNLLNDGKNAYGYDDLNRLTSVNGSKLRLQYDPAGRLYEENANGSRRRMAYDGSRLIGEFTTSGSVTQRYVHGPGTDEVLVWYEGSGTSDKRYLVADERGSIVLVTNASGRTMRQNKYDSYGLPDASNLGRFGYTGQVYLKAVGIYHYKARAYAPHLGRFLQPDPIRYGDGLNMYVYAGNDPNNLKDPTGLAQTSGYYTCTGSRIRRKATKSKPASCAIVGGMYVSPNTVAAVGGGSPYPGGGNSYGTSSLRAGLPLNPRTAEQIAAAQQQTTGSLLGKLWTLPNTVIGLVLGTANTALGALIGNDVGIEIGNNAVQFIGGAIGGGGALTLGNSVLYSGSERPESFGAYRDISVRLGDHERSHTYQAEVLGPFYLFAYLLSGPIADVHRNTMERDAQGYAHPGIQGPWWSGR